MKLKPVSTIKADLGINPNGKVQKFFTERCAEYMDKYVPFDTGALSSYVIEGTNIVYQQPYAHYMYIGDVMGPNIPIMESGTITGWFSPKGKAKHYTGKKIDYSASVQRGHTYAGAYWDKRMWSAEKEKIIKEVQDYVNRGR